MKRPVKIAGTLTLGLALLAAGGCSEQTSGPTTADFQKQRAQVVRTRRHGDRYPMWVADIHAWRGERDAAFGWLDRALERRDAELRWVKSSPWYRSLRGDPRWKALLGKMGLPED